MSFTSKILLGLALGIGTGLFLGELAAPLGVVGEGFIRLLQITVLPYIVVSLLGSIGRLSVDRARTLITWAGLVFVLLIAIGVVLLTLMPLAFPEREAGAFFSTSLVETTDDIDFLDLLVPSNPFAALANSVVPAIVLFCILLGVGLMGVEKKDALLAVLDALDEGLNRVNKLVIRLTPVGVFAIAANTAGTMTLEEISRLQAYLIGYTVLGAILGLVVLPRLVEALTPIRGSDVLSVSKDTLITIFATGKIIVVLPQLVDAVREILRRHDLLDDESDRAAEILLPLAYPFPNLGTLTIMMFVPFSAWYLGTSLGFGDHAAFLAALIPSSFVAPVVGIPFLLELVRLPADMFELFAVSTVYTDRIRVVVGGISLLALALLTIAGTKGVFQVRWARLVPALTTCAVSTVAAVAAVWLYLGFVLQGTYTGDDDFTSMQLSNEPTTVKDFRQESLSPPSRRASGDRVVEIQESGALRVGFSPDALPFAFVNDEGQTVGFDIDLAHALALDLGVELHLYRLSRERALELLKEGRLDILMTGIPVTPHLSAEVEFSEPYLEENLAFLVPDHRRSAFTSWAKLKELDPKIGVVTNDHRFSPWLQSILPGAELVPVPSPRPFLRGQTPDLDALLVGAEGGSAWTLIYPAFSVAVPRPNPVRVPLAYPVAPDAPNWMNFINRWIEIRRSDGTLDRVYDHWILGKGARDEEPRWSVLRNVFGWVD